MIRTYERVGAVLRDRPIPDKRTARFIDGHIYRGHADKSRHHNARRWRLFWRLKARRKWQPLCWLAVLGDLQREAQSERTVATAKALGNLV